MTPEYPIFKTHGITADMNLLTIRIQELAIAMNLQGIHQAAVDYNPALFSHGGHELTVMTKAAEASWHSSKHHNVQLPSSASTDAEHLESLRQLGATVEALTTLLEEGRSS